MTDAHALIDKEVKSNDVVLFMKGTPQFPMCGFSGQDDNLRQGIKTYSNWPTIPQLYVKGEFVGGCDIIREMFQSGELQSHLSEKGITVKQPARA
jgi:monothiol glutaredoxin